MRLYILYIFVLISVPVFSQGKGSHFPKEITTALTILNETRRAAGLDTVTISVTFSNGCYKHAEYLVINKNDTLTSGMSAHKEYPKLPGYSKEGEIAAKRAVIHFIKPSLAMDGWIQTFYHRIPLLQPNLREIGIGFYEKDDYVVTLIDCISGCKGEKSKKVVCYPNENQTNIPLFMGPEIPHPVGEDGSHGFPITIYFTQWQNITNVNFRLTNKDNKVIDCYISTPEKPATYFDQWNCICAIPKEPLIKGSKYFVTVTCTVDSLTFKKTYSFQTVKTY